MGDNFRDRLSRSVSLTASAISSVVAHSHNADFLQRIRALVEKKYADNPNLDMRYDGLGESVKHLASIKLTEISERIYGIALNNHKDDNQPGLVRAMNAVTESVTDEAGGESTALNKIDAADTALSNSLSQYEELCGVDYEDWNWACGQSETPTPRGESAFGVGLPSMIDNYDLHGEPLVKKPATQLATFSSCTSAALDNADLQDTCVDVSHSNVNQRDGVPSVPHVSAGDEVCCRLSKELIPGNAERNSNDAESTSFLEDFHADFDFSWSEIDSLQAENVRKCHTSNKDLERSAPVRAEKQDGGKENLFIGDRDADADVGPKTDQNFINQKEDIHVVVQDDDDSFDISWNDI